MITNFYGMRCYGCDADLEIDLRECRDTFDAANRLDRMATGKGWGLGQADSGQHVYSCPECGPALFNFKTFPEF